jgi:hypothetical protein
MAVTFRTALGGDYGPRPLHLRDSPSSSALVARSVLARTRRYGPVAAVIIRYDVLHGRGTSSLVRT